MRCSVLMAAMVRPAVSGENRFFTLTVWPGKPVPLQRHERRAYRWDSTETVLIPDMTSPPVPAIAGGETYLELAALDLDDSAALLRFVNRHANLGLFDSWETPSSWPIFAEPEILALSPPCERLCAQLSAARREAERVIEDERERLLGGDSKPSLLREDWNVWDDDSVETRAEFVAVAQLIRDAFHVWLALKDDRRLGDLVFESPLAQGPLFEAARSDQPTRTSVEVQSFLKWFFAVTLEPFHPQVNATWSTRHLGEGPSLVLPTDELPHAMRLYQICALELISHIASEADYKVCANERCWRRPLFVFQDPHKSSFTGIKHHDALYCSEECRDAKNQRDSRERRRAAARRQEHR